MVNFPKKYSQAQTSLLTLKLSFPSETRHSHTPQHTYIKIDSDQTILIPKVLFCSVAY